MAKPNQAPRKARTASPQKLFRKSVRRAGNDNPLNLFNIGFLDEKGVSLQFQGFVGFRNAPKLLADISADGFHLFGVEVNAAFLSQILEGGAAGHGAEIGRASCRERV